jgi:folate-binding protein YgfZ
MKRHLKQDNSSGYAALRDAAALVERAGTALVRVGGADRRAYLQGLLTNDIEALTPGTGCYAAMLNAQGRMLTDMRVIELGDAILLSVPRGVAAAIAEHLDRFVFSEDVQIEEAASLAEIGLYGPGALRVLKAAGTEGGASPELFGSTRVRIGGVDAVLVRTDDIGIDGYAAIADRDALAGIARALVAAGAVPAAEADAEAVRIESGRPRFGADMDADTIPLEAGIEDRAISRSKGCYVGQEVIVRVQDRGQGRVARRLVGLTLPAGAAVPPPGTAIAADGKSIGRVTSAALSPSLARPVALGYVHRDYTADGTPVLVGAGEAIVRALPAAVGQARD